jgi:hypothetical protein
MSMLACLPWFCQPLALLKMEPSVLLKDFSGEVVYEGPQWLWTTPSNASIALFNERVFSHDRLPLSTSRCVRGTGQVVRMVEMQEDYNVACCERVNATLHVCPRLPVGAGSLVYSMLLYESRPVYFSPVLSANPQWVQSSLTTTYAYGNRTEGVVRLTMGSLLLSIMVLAGLHMLVGGAHKWSNENPGFCVAAHVLWSIGMTILLFVILDETGDDLFRAGIVHTVVQIMYSIVLVYIPSDGYHAPDQRIEVSSRSVVSEIANNPSLKWFAVHVFALSTVLNALSMYTVFNILWVRFDAAFDMLFLAVLGYFLMLVLFYVAFLTAIYDIHSPLKIDSDTIVMGQGGVCPVESTGLVQMFDYQQNMFAKGARFEHDTIVAMTDRLLCWEIGTFSHGEVVLHEFSLQDAGCCGSVYARLPQCTEFKLALYSIDRQGSLFCIGDVTNKERGYHVHLFHTYTLKFFQFLLRIAPIFDESEGKYEVNVVENLRGYTQKRCQTVFRRRPCLAGAVYQIAFLLVTTASAYCIVATMISSSAEWWPFYLVEILLVSSTAVFALHVSTKKRTRLEKKVSLLQAPKKRSGGRAIPLELTFEEATDTYESDVSLLVKLLAPNTELRRPSLYLVDRETDNIVSQYTIDHRCPKNHRMYLTQTSNGKWTCDECAKGLQQCTTVFYCPQCNHCNCCFPCTIITAKDGSLRLGKGAPISYNGRWYLMLR